jgi:hypothetical protein
MLFCNIDRSVRQGLSFTRPTFGYNSSIKAMKRSVKEVSCYRYLHPVHFGRSSRMTAKVREFTQNVNFFIQMINEN